MKRIRETPEEIAELRDRLEEAEQTIEAIRAGHVDALVVGGPEGERVFTLQGADHRYRRIVEDMTEGAVIVDPGGVVLYANAAFARLVERPLDRVVGTLIREYIPTEARSTFDHLIRDAERATTGAQTKHATLLRTADRVIPVHVSASIGREPVTPGEAPSTCIIVTDLSATLRDAERKRTELSADLETAMRTNEAQRKLFESLFSNAPAALSLLRGPEMIVELANARALQIWDRKSEDAIGRPLVDVLPEIASQKFPALLAEVYRTGIPFVGNQLPIDLSIRNSAPANDANDPNGATVGKHGDTRARFLNTVYTPTRDAEGAIDGIAAFTIDVTSQVEAGERAARSEAQFRDLVDNLPDLAWQAQPSGTIGFFNKRWYEYTGTTYEQMRDDGWMTVHRPDLLNAVVLEFRASIASGRPFEMEFPLRGADGNYRWFLTRMRALRDDAGTIVSWIGTNTDIDERKRALDVIDLLAQSTAALSASLDYQETLARVADIAVPRLADLCAIHLLAEDGTTSQVVARHAAPRTIEGVQTIHRESLLRPGGPLGYLTVMSSGETQFVPQVDLDVLRASAVDDRGLELLRGLNMQSWVGIPLKRRGRTIGSLSFWYTTPGRRYLPADVQVLEEIGKRASLAIENARLYRDATNAVEAERRARDKAEEATRLKDEFLATLSHELRTPLNAILGWSRMLQSGSLPEEKRARAIETVVRNASAQNQLIEDMLDLGRIISGKMRINVDNVDMATVVEAAIDVVQPAADARGVRLHSDLGDDRSIVAGDGGRLQQVMWNLLSNAVKFTPRDGRVDVHVTRTEATVEIAVADSGNGIDPEFLPYVFDRFRQQDGASTRKAGGLGLGLAIVKSIVELHGGMVEARSDGDGKGSTFVVRIPVKAVRISPLDLGQTNVRAEIAERGIVTCPPEILDLRILVVDDEPDARDLMRALLEHCGAKVVTAGSAAEALSTLEAHAFDVLVSDIGMPEENGYSLIRKVRARPDDALPAIALTAYARADDRRRALTAGFDRHVVKPVDSQELLLVIASLMRRKHPRT